MSLNLNFGAVSLLKEDAVGLVSVFQAAAGSFEFQAAVGSSVFQAAAGSSGKEGNNRLDMVLQYTSLLFQFKGILAADLVAGTDLGHSTTM